MCGLSFIRFPVDPRATPDRTSLTRSLAASLVLSVTAVSGEVACVVCSTIDDARPVVLFGTVSRSNSDDAAIAPVPHLILKNPHSVLAVFETRPQDVFEIRVESGRLSESWQQVSDRARQAGVTVHQATGSSGGKRRGGGPQRGGGSEAVVQQRQGVDLDELFAAGEAERGLWLGLDQLQDPQNVGAVFRTAAFFGVRGIVLTRDRSAPLTAAVYDVASGGVEHVPFSIQPNLSRVVDAAKKSGMWVLGTSEHAERDVAGVDRDRKWLVLVGNEERGLRRLSLDVCDETCRITPRGRVGSLNVSAATAVVVATLSGGGSQKG